MAKEKSKQSGKIKKQPTEKQLAARAKFTAAAKARANAKKAGKYKLEVFIGGESFNCETTDLQGAILDLKPAKIVNRVRIIVERGDSRIEKVLFVMQARRIFRNTLACQFFVKNLILALK